MSQRRARSPGEIVLDLHFSSVVIANASTWGLIACNYSRDLTFDVIP